MPVVWTETSAMKPGPPRPPLMCPGCPHRPVFDALRRLKAVVSGDIVMYTPDKLNQFDAIVMNNSSGPWITPTAADMEKEALKKLGGDAKTVEAALRKKLFRSVRIGLSMWLFVVMALTLAVFRSSKTWVYYEGTLAGK